MTIKDLAIDLGNNNTLLSDRQSILAAQPSCVVLNRSTNKMEAYGDEAYRIFGKSNKDFKAVKPLQGGVICDSESTNKLLDALIGSVRGTGFFKPALTYLVSGVPYDTTNVERRALREALGRFRANKSYLIFEPLAAAVGMGLDIRAPRGKMIVDIGGGITEVVVISLSGIAAFKSIKVAGDAMDNDICDYLLHEHHLEIGLKTAEELKIKLGCVHTPMASGKNTFVVRGKDRAEGIPSQRTISQSELCHVLGNVFSKIEVSIHQTLDNCPPELCADIYEHGIHITGGSAQLLGVRERLEKVFSVPVRIDTHALTSVSTGLSEIVGNAERYRGVLI